MAVSPSLLAAVRSFDNWSQPWRFKESVAASLDAAGAEVFEQIWRVATNPAHWDKVDLAPCAADALMALQRRFPRLDSDVNEAIVRAAAYEWR
jgi:hypothetical protein